MVVAAVSDVIRGSARHRTVARGLFDDGAHHRGRVRVRPRGVGRFQGGPQCEQVGDGGVDVGDPLAEQFTHTAAWGGALVAPGREDIVDLGEVEAQGAGGRMNTASSIVSRVKSW